MMKQPDFEKKSLTKEQIFTQWLTMLIMAMATEVLSAEALKAIYETAKKQYGTCPHMDQFQTTLLFISETKRVEREKDNE